AGGERRSSLAHRLDPEGLDDPRNRDDLVPAPDEGPRLALRAGNLRIDEHVLDLLPPSGQTVARPPGSHSKAWQVGGDPPRSPADLAAQLHRSVLEPEPVVLADGLQPAAEIDALRAGGGRQQLRDRGRQQRALVERAEEVLVGGRVQPPEQRQDLVADQAALRLRVRGVDAEVELLGPAVGLRLLPPEREQWADDAVLAAHLDPRRTAARDEPVEDRLDLVRGGVPRRAQPVGRDGVAQIAQLLLGRSASHLHHFRAEGLAAEARVPRRLLAAQAVVDVQRGDAVAELPQRVPQAGRVGAARDEAGDLAAGRDQLVP